MKKAAEESRRGRRSGPAVEPLGAGWIDDDRVAARGSTSAPAAASIRSLWSRVGSGSTTRVSPSASRPAKSRQDLTWALATGSSYSMPCSGGALDLQRRQPLLAAAQLGAHLAQRRGDPVDRAAADRVVAVERPARRPPARRASPAAAAAACRRCRRRSPLGAGRAGRRPSIAARRADRSVAALDPRRPSASTASRVERVSAASR